MVDDGIEVVIDIAVDDGIEVVIDVTVDVVVDCCVDFGVDEDITLAVVVLVILCVVVEIVSEGEEEVDAGDMTSGVQESRIASHINNEIKKVLAATNIFLFNLSSFLKQNNFLLRS